MTDTEIIRIFEKWAEHDPKCAALLDLYRNWPEDIKDERRTHGTSPPPKEPS
ncbi:hypothetical protein ACFL2Q_17915 [Thermodesulfobacteriota bacterium]